MAFIHGWETEREKEKDFACKSERELQSFMRLCFVKHSVYPSFPNSIGNPAKLAQQQAQNQLKIWAG